MEWNGIEQNGFVAIIISDTKYIHAYTYHLMYCKMTMK